MTELPADRAWKRVADAAAPQDELLEVCVELSPVQSKCQFAMCTIDPFTRAAGWLDATTRLPLQDAWRVTHWRPV